MLVLSDGSYGLCGAPHALANPTITLYNEQAVLVTWGQMCCTEVDQQVQSGQFCKNEGLN